MERSTSASRQSSAFHRVQLAHESRYEVDKQSRNRIQPHLQHLHRGSAPKGISSPLAACQAALIPNYNPIVSQTIPKLVLSNRSQNTCISIQRTKNYMKPVSTAIFSCRNSIGLHLRHSHADLTYFQRFESYQLLRHSPPTRPAYRSGNQVCLPHFAWQIYSFPGRPSHLASSNRFHSHIYSHLRPLTINGHQHLHTYPPFKGGKCNSGSGRLVNRT